jgi:hypothetical protein
MNRATETQARAGRLLCAPLSLAGIATTIACAPQASAALTSYADEASWRAAAGAVTTVAAPNINLPTGSLYLPELGLAASIGVGPIPSFLVDPWGLPAGTNVLGAGSISTPWSRDFVFAQPIATAFAIDWLFNESFWPGQYNARFYYGGTLIGTVNLEGSDGIPGPTRFYGFTSTLPFNHVVLSGISISYGRAVMFTQIPAPGAVALFALAPLVAQRRRRS